MAEIEATRGLQTVAASPSGNRLVASGPPGRPETLTVTTVGGASTPLHVSAMPAGQIVGQITDGGSAVVAWVGDRRLWVAAFDGTRWVTASAEGVFASPRVAIARNGTAVVAGTSGGPRAFVFGWQYSPRNGWERQPHIFTKHALQAASVPDAAVRVSGVATIAWAARDGRVVIGDRGTDGRWRGTQVIATEHPQSLLRAAIAFDPSGRALLAWTRTGDRRVVTRTRLSSFRWTPRAEFPASRASAFTVDFSLGVNGRGTAALMAVVQGSSSAISGLPTTRTLTGLVARTGRAYLPTSTVVVAPSRDLMTASPGPVSVSDANTFVTAWADPSGGNAPDNVRAACGRVPLR